MVGEGDGQNGRNRGSWQGDLFLKSRASFPLISTILILGDNQGGKEKGGTKVVIPECCHVSILKQPESSGRNLAMWQTQCIAYR